MQTVGNSALILKLEVPKKIIYCIYLAIGFCYGLVGLAVAQVLINITGALINMWATKRIVKYRCFGLYGDCFYCGLYMV